MLGPHVKGGGKGGGDGGGGSATRETMSWGASPVLERCDCMPQPLPKVGTTIQPLLGVPESHAVTESVTSTE